MSGLGNLPLAAPIVILALLGLWYVEQVVRSREQRALAAVEPETNRRPRPTGRPTLHSVPTGRAVPRPPASEDVREASSSPLPAA